MTEAAHAIVSSVPILEFFLQRDQEISGPSSDLDLQHPLVSHFRNNEGTAIQGQVTFSSFNSINPVSLTIVHLLLVYFHEMETKLPLCTDMI
jgi:hypothetical protein